MRRGLYCAVAFAVICGCLAGCARQEKDILKQVDSSGTLTVALPKQDGEGASRQWASQMEKQVIEELCRERSLQVRYVYTAQDDLCQAVDDRRADIAAGTAIVEDGGNAGYSVTYGSRPLYIVSEKGSGISSIGKLANQAVGIESGLGREVKRQFYPVSGIELEEYQNTDEVKAQIQQGKIAGYVCYQEDAGKLLAEGGLWVQDLARIQTESYAFYAGEEQYGLLGEINRLLTENLRE